MRHVPHPARFRWAVTAVLLLCVWPPPVQVGRFAPSGQLGALRAGSPPSEPAFHPEGLPASLQQEFLRQNFKLDPHTGNFLSPRVAARTRRDELVPVLIDGKYVKDLRGQTVFLRASIRNKLLAADEAMFAKKHKHLVINYGFRSNKLQQELYLKIHGSGKVAGVGGSFHEAGMALDLNNWRDSQHFMIDAGFVGGCYGIEEDLVHYSIDEISKASNVDAFKRCTLKEIPEDILKGVKKAGQVTGKVGKVTFGKLRGK
jgi:hypothetical protein